MLLSPDGTRASREVIMSSVQDSDAIVIGSGPSGLTCAAYLAATGKKVLVFDRHFEAGGNATTFAHDGYEFDVGLHYIGECHPGGQVPMILDPLGIGVKFRELDPDGFDTFILPDDTRFRWPKGLPELRARLHEAFPAESDGIDRFMDTVVGLDSVMQSLSEPMTPRRMLEAPLKLWPVIRHYRTTVAGYLDSLGPSPGLRSILGAHNGIYALAPSRAPLILHALVISHFSNGAFYPEGGGQRISDEMATFVREMGGEIVLRTPVEEIIVEKGRARGVRVRPPAHERRARAQEEFRAPLVISSADLKHTYLEMVGPDHLPAGLVSKVRRYTMTLPIFAVYLILDRDLRAEGHPNTNLSVLGEDVEAMYADAEAGRFPDDPWVFACSATLKDPGNARAARPGQTNVQLMTLAPRDHAFWGIRGGPHMGERYRRNPAYVARKNQYQEALIDKAERAIPGIRDSIVHVETASPITHERFMDSSGGTSYGIECTPGQFLLGRPRMTTPIPGLFLTGSSTMFAHGIVAAMLGGMMTASVAAGIPFPKTITGDHLARRLAADPIRRRAAPPGTDRAAGKAAV